MIVAPELFTPARALDALRLADATIRGPLGMKTLDPSDSQYRPNFDNANDGTDQAVAKGCNVSYLISQMFWRYRCACRAQQLMMQYHQGPEWGFPLGWFLMAYLKFDRLAGDGNEVSHCDSNSPQLVYIVHGGLRS